jgi:hypothetical protein
MNTIIIERPGMAFLMLLGNLSRKRKTTLFSTPKFQLGQQIYFIRYDLIHCAFVHHVMLKFGEGWRFFYLPDNAQDEEDCVPEEACFATLEELIEDLKSKMIVSQML